MPPTPDGGFLTRLLAFAGAALAAAAPAAASPCASAALRAEAMWGVPPRLLLAIGVVESGLDPSAINAEGAALRPSSPAEAAERVRALRADGVRSIDVGCFQVNLKWHPQAFATLEQAFAPDTNAQYAARHLVDLYGTAGSWTAAVGLYHSADPQRQDVYRAKVAAAVRALRDGLDPAQAGPAATGRADGLPDTPDGTARMRRVRVGPSATPAALRGAVPTRG